MIKKLGKIGAFLYIAAIVVATVLFTIRDADRNLRKEIVIEAGSEIKIEDFFNDCPDDARFVCDISDINTNEPAIYKLTVFYGETFEKDVILKIEDHTGPRGIALPKSIYTTWKVPAPESCVGYLYDLSGIAKIEYQNGTPSFSEGGEYKVPVAVTDTYGNTTVIDVPFTVIDDHTAPVITGVHDIEAGEDLHDLDYFTGIKVKDDYDPEPVLKVNDSLVNYRLPGTYEVIYMAVDKAGNLSSVKAKITIAVPDTTEENEFSDLDAEYDYYTYGSGDVYSIAANIMSGLWRGSDVETARAIFNWVHSHIYYQTIMYYQTYEAAAYRGFSRHNGDCYVYYACAKMLLDCAGIPNMMVQRSPVTSNGHYWNLVYLDGGWYHCDATVFRDHPGVYFMCTDEEIDDYHHQFNGYLYPERAGGSTAYASPTPTPTLSPTPSPSPSPSPSPVPVISETTVPTVSDTPEPSPVITVEPSKETEATESTDQTEETENTDTPSPSPDPQNPNGDESSDI